MFKNKGAGGSTAFGKVLKKLRFWYEKASLKGGAPKKVVICHDFLKVLKKLRFWYGKS